MGGSNGRGAWMLALALVGCAEDEVPTVPAEFEVRAGVEIATVLGAEPGTALTLYDPDGNRRLTTISDELGNAHFSYVPDEYARVESGDGARLPFVDGNTLAPGSGYVIRTDDTNPIEASAPFDVLGVHDVPDPSLYDGQVLTGVNTYVLGGLQPGQNTADGFQYIEVRDGVKLSAMVRFPDPNVYGDGPYPTVVEYSGYSTSKPDDAEPGSFIANLLGYATVGVNMRGTGCSGGVFDVFNTAQHADGYDVIETVARQDWVLDHRVGMVGLSYSGIAQLFVAYTRPPSLAAVTPLSTIADPWEMQWPGGVYNMGFTRQWLDQRNSESEVGGMDWVTTQVAMGDTKCSDNLTLRGLNIDFESFLHGLEFRPRDADERSLPVLVHEIDVPVYQTGAFQDEQTGALWAGMLDHYTNDSAKFILYNGRHPDGYSPLVLTRWWEFLELFVARRVPRMHPLIRASAGAEFSATFGVEGLGFEDDRFADFADDDYEGVLAAWKAEPRVRVLFENGAGDADQPGAPVSRYESSFSTWPPAEAQPMQWFLQDGGVLGSDAPANEAADAYRFDPAAGATTFFGPRGYELTVPVWDINWTEFTEGDVVSYVTEPLAADTVIAGPGYADLWIRSEVDDASVQVTLTEVRPDGNEFLVQSGWLRLGHRKVDTDAAEPWRIVRSYGKDDFEPVPVGEYIDVQVAIPSVAHALRAGSRLRVSISAPGRNHGTWEFESPTYDAAPTFLIAHGGARASSLTMPIVTGVAVAPEYPACPSLRGQPCRTYRPVSNTPG